MTEKKKKECKHLFKVAKEVENREYRNIYVMVILFCEKCGESKVINEKL